MNLLCKDNNEFVQLKNQFTNPSYDYPEKYPVIVVPTITNLFIRNNLYGNGNSLTMNPTFSHSTILNFVYPDDLRGTFFNGDIKELLDGQKS
jgi:hypothetical protein